MKKIISILGGLSLSAAASSSAIACTDPVYEPDLITDCQISNVSVSGIDTDDISNINFEVVQYVNNPSKVDTNLFSVINDENSLDQKFQDDDSNNLKDVAISDIKINIDQDRIKKFNDKTNNNMAFSVSFKVKIESISEHHVFEWIRYTNNSKTEYNVFQIFTANLPGVKQ